MEILNPKLDIGHQGYNIQVMDFGIKEDVSNKNPKIIINVTIPQFKLGVECNATR